jgi:predicted unusual protein kinase regulating ubiquinone biosynthesis (AarF/ABC1/UbiB family)
MLRLDAQPAEALGAGSVGQVFRASVRGVRVVVKLPK